MSTPSERYLQRPGHVCPAEHAGWLTGRMRNLITNPERILEGLVNESDTAVDVGCGPGFFTLPLARMVGPSGRVIAVDIQDEMLAKLHARAEHAGLLDHIQPHAAAPDSLCLAGPDIDGRADFALAFWMVHEVPDRDRFLKEVAAVLKPGGRLLIVEPKGHVSKAEFARTAEAAKNAGFVPIAGPRVFFSYAALLRRA